MPIHKRKWRKYQDRWILLEGDTSGSIHIEHHGPNTSKWDALKIFWMDPERVELKGGDWLWVPRSGPMRYGNNWEDRGFSTHLPDRLFVPSGLKHIIPAVRLMPLLPEVRKLHGQLPPREQMITFKTHVVNADFRQWAIIRSMDGGKIRVYWRA